MTKYVINRLIRGLISVAVMVIIVMVMTCSFGNYATMTL